MRFSTLNDWLAWQETLHPKQIDLGLDRVQSVWQRLRGAKPAPIVITVAGTNGKGSSVAILDAIYRSAGYRVGTYTSPHLLRYNERIRINGQDVEDARLCDAFAAVDVARGETSLSYFEFGTLAAFEIFATERLDVAILEVGLGGRLDAVNIIDADVALIATIDLDHAAWLGNDRESVGREKAGIMRAGRPAVCSDPRPPHTVFEHAAAIGASLKVLGRDFGFEAQNAQWQWRSETTRRDVLPWPALRGEFQLRNAAGVVMTIESLQVRLPVSQQALRIGLGSVQLAGRFQVLPGPVPVILDVAHNPEAATALAANLRAWPQPGKTLAVVAMMADKDLTAIFSAIAAQIDAWYVTTVAIERAAKAEQLIEVLHQLNVMQPIHAHANVTAALGAAQQAASTDDRIVVFGSFYTVAEVLATAYNPVD
ncbi:MAG: bifunctional tetrahydrofolate synthase/dihydrofolate synthase [Gammaproteobacteria bacterium]|nr:bifunctional tetrahydrofolate synthase/dihydrofolate synthase [Gammaproteobacteria bacterium]